MNCVKVPRCEVHAFWYVTSTRVQDVLVFSQIRVLFSRHCSYAHSFAWMSFSDMLLRLLIRTGLPHVSGGGP